MTALPALETQVGCAAEGDQRRRTSLRPPAPPNRPSDFAAFSCATRPLALVARRRQLRARLSPKKVAPRRLAGGRPAGGAPVACETQLARRPVPPAVRPVAQCWRRAPGQRGGGNVLLASSGLRAARGAAQRRRSSPASSGRRPEPRSVSVRAFLSPTARPVCPPPPLGYTDSIPRSLVPNGAAFASWPLFFLSIASP